VDLIGVFVLLVFIPRAYVVSLLAAGYMMLLLEGTLSLSD
jgi:hypothetical protein